MGMLLAGAAVMGGCAHTEGLLTYSQQARNRGIVLYNEGNYPDAAGAFRDAIRQVASDFESHYYLGRCYEAMGQYHNAVTSYTTAHGVLLNSLKAEDSDAFRMKVLEGLASAGTKGSVPVGVERAARNGTQPTADDYIVSAKAMRMLGDIDSALDHYNHAARLAGTSFPVAKEHGLYLTQLGQKQKATAELKRAYVLNKREGNPEDAEITAALRQMGIVPGPSLGEEGDLVKPPLPRGPLPEVDLSDIGLGASADSNGRPRE